MMFGNKVVDFIKQQATVLLGANVGSASEAAPSESSGDDDRETQVLVAAMMGAMYMGAGADGEITEDEYEYLKKLFADVSENMLDDAGFDELFDKTADLIDEEGFDAAIADIAKNVTDPEQRQSVLTILIASGIADTAGEEDKQVLVHQMAEAFGISQEQLEAYYTEVETGTN